MDFPVQVPIDRERITVAGTAIGLTTSKITTQVGCALCQVITARIWLTTNGTAPLTDGTIGMYFDPGQYFLLTGPDMLALKVIRNSTTSAALEVIYYGKGG